MIGVYRQGFSRHACAGLDCLSAKGAMLVRIALPGVPTPVDLMTVHMNAQGAARVRDARTLAAHRYQSLESARFLQEARDLASTCDVWMSWDGEVVSLRPERDQAVFDGPETGGKLSDHDGYLATYTLSWPAIAPSLRTCLLQSRPSG